MADNSLHVHILLDRSGSMEDCRDRTIDAVNEYLNSLKKNPGTSTRLSLTTFDSEGIDLIYNTLRVAEVPKLTRNDLVPRANTPLLDAVGQTVAKLDQVTLLEGERVALVILTDGLENASREYKPESIRRILTERQEKRNWLVLYLGANQDAWAVGNQIGVQAANAMDFAVGHVGEAMQSAAASVQRYRSAPAASARKAAGFTPSERARSRGDSGSSQA